VDGTAAAVRSQVGGEINAVASRIAVSSAVLPAGEAAAAGARVRSERTAHTAVTPEYVAGLIDRQVAGPGAGAAPVGGSLGGASAERVRAATRGLSEAVQDAMADRVETLTRSALIGAGPSVPAKTAAIRLEVERAARASLDDLKRTASPRTRKALERAESELTNAIEEAMVASDPEVSDRHEWLDPYIGIRGRLNISSRFFAGARADVGGIGIGSDLTWQAFAGVGYKLTEHIDAELGWRHLVIDYEEDDFAVDATLSGVTIGMAFRF
jgi:hypothetical protein